MVLYFTPNTSLRVRRRRHQNSFTDLSGEDDFLAVVVMMMVDMLTIKSLFIALFQMTTQMVISSSSVSHLVL